MFTLLPSMIIELKESKLTKCGLSKSLIHFPLNPNHLFELETHIDP